MSEPQVLQVNFEDGGNIQIHWSRPDEGTNFGTTFYTTVISREGVEASEDLSYYASEIRDDAHELIMAWLKLMNRSDSLASR